MAKKGGIIIKLQDGRHCVVLNDQPLIEQKGVVVLNLCDEFGSLIIDAVTKKPKIIMKSVEEYNMEIETSKLIGFIN